MAEVGEPKRRIIVAPAEEPAPVDVPFAEPAETPVEEPATPATPAPAPV